MPELLSKADQSELERIHTSNMPARCSSMRPPAVVSGTGVTRQDGGTRTLTPAQVLSAEPCRVAPASNAREFIVGDQVVASSYRWVGLTKGRDVKPRDEFTVTHGSLVNGVWESNGQVQQFEVVGLQNPHSYEVGVFALCKLKGAP